MTDPEITTPATAPVVFEVEHSGADGDGWDPDDPYGNAEEYERGEG